MFTHRLRAALITLVLITVAPSLARAAAEATPTFHSIGLTWSGSGGGAAVACNVRYRAMGSTTWRTGLPLWFDARAAGAGSTAARPAAEYRGSLVNLVPGTTYEIELSLAGTSTMVSLTSATWSERFPIGTTNTIPAGSTSTTLSITTSGTRTGYALHAPAPGGTATIDVASARDNCIVIDAAYVIIRGLTLRGARINAIELGPNAHDVIVENNDISGWGRISTVDGAGTNWGAAADAAVACNNHRTVERIIVQRNRIHHPRSDSNNWEEPRPSRGGDPHPQGPQAVTFETCGGNHVFRYNDIYSDADHYFQDAIGGGDNFAFEGFPRSDSDIYGNNISQCWDDGIEAEGGNRNVRVWGNFIDQTYVKLAVAATAIGPIYLFRNVANVSRRSASTVPATVDAEDRGPFLKSGSRDANYRGGRVYVFHNTLLQPRDARYVYTLGSGYGLEDSGGAMTALVSRNNILHIHRATWGSINDTGASPSNDFNFDLYNGRINGTAGQESGGFMGTPVYDPRNAMGVWALDPSSRGFDVGARLNGFNDDFAGAGPDVGAYESGVPPLEFGVTAYLTPMPPRDGGVDDASVSDTGPQDARIGSDAGAVADAMARDAAADGADGGTTMMRGACGCRIQDPRTKHGLALACVAVSALVRRRRRRAA